MYYVYVLKSESVSEKYYIGYSSDLRKRLEYHNQGDSLSTKRYLPWTIVYYEAYRSRRDAMERERQLKRHGGAWNHLRNRIVRSLNES